MQFEFFSLLITVEEFYDVGKIHAACAHKVKN